MTQSNFMRNLRMTMPQYITNVTSFNDAVRILKNKSILVEYYDGPSEPMGDEALGDYYDMVGEKLEDIAKEKYNLDEIELEQMFESEWHSGKNDKYIEKCYKDGDEPSVTAERIIEDYINMSDMIQNTEDDLGPDKYKFNDFEGGLSEDKTNDKIDQSELNFLKKLYAKNPTDKIKKMIDDLENKLNEETDQEKDSRRQKTSKELDQALLTFLKNLNSKSPTDHIAKKIKDQEAEMAKKYGSLSEAKKKAEPKAKLHPNQIHPGELRMGIRVEMEHTDDPKKAEKIALDHLAENPFYYTALKLAGVESPSAPKVKAPVEKKARKKKEAVELVDKANQMQKVKLKEVKLNISGEPNAVVKQVEEFIKKADNPILDTLQSKDEFELQQTQDPNEALLRYGYWKELPKEAVDVFENEFNVEVDRDNDEDTGSITVYRLTPKSSLSEKYSSLIPILEKMIREAITEYYDGRDNLINTTDDTE